MNKYALRIELLSDTCCGTGEGNGATKDVLSTYDKYGLPYIPAKRIKGILRSNAIFLKEYEQYNQKEIEQLFGVGTKEGALRIGNAQLIDQEKLVNIIRQHPQIFKPKAVERAYTTQRTATAIEVGTSVAKDQALRTFGAIPKGEVFSADLWLDSSNEKTEDLLQSCVKLLRHIGLNRTRGYGEVKATLTLIEQENSGTTFPKLTEKKLTYRIELLTPMVSESDYIAGSALQGVFASYMLRDRDDVYVNNFLTKVHFGNGYLMENGQQLIPVPLSMVKKKNEEGTLYSEIDGFQKNIEAQYTKVSGYGLVVEPGKFYHTDVKKRIDYHFTTEPDKEGNHDMTSEGNANDNRGDLFTYSLIEEGQVFGGTITVEDKSVAKDIVDSLNFREGIIYLGRSSRVQYGKCKMIIDEQKGEKSNASSEGTLEGKEWVLEFLSDTILVNEEGVNLANKETLNSAVKALFIDEADIEVKAIYANTTVVAGYNAKWKLPKRRYQAFSKGTQILVKGQPKNREGYIGLLQSEGYGAYRIRTISELNKYTACKNFDPEKSDDVQRGATSTSDLQTLQWVIINEIKDYLASQAHKFIDSRKDVLSSMTATEANRLREPFRLMVNRDYKEALANFKSYLKINLLVR